MRFKRTDAGLCGRRGWKTDSFQDVCLICKDSCATIAFAVLLAQLFELGRSLGPRKS